MYRCKCDWVFSEPNDGCDYVHPFDGQCCPECNSLQFMEMDRYDLLSLVEEALKEHYYKFDTHERVRIIDDLLFSLDIDKKEREYALRQVFNGKL